MTAAVDSPYKFVDERSRRRGGLGDEVGTYIRDLILTGALRPGMKIDQEMVGRALGVSRSPIREALVALGKEGLLDVTPRRGAFVAELTREDIIDHYELYGVVSGRAAALAAEILDRSAVDELTAIHDRFIVNAADDLSQLNDDFHRIINSVAPRRTRWLLGHLVRSVPSQYYEFASGWNAQAVDHHSAILEAIVERDADRARSAMEHHLRESGVAAADSLEEQGFWQ